jgi:flagellar motor switch protein FliM
MAEKVLSQGEMDALLKEGPQGGKSGGAALGGIRSYDLTSQQRVIPSRILTLEMINEEFARLFQASLGAMIMKEVEFVGHPIETAQCGDLMLQIPAMSSINLIGMDPLKGNALVIIDTKTVSLLLENFFGGSGRIQTKESGAFSPIEGRFIRKIVDLMIADLQKAWRPVHSVGLSYVRGEMNPKLAMVVSPKEMMIVTHFSLKVGSETQKVTLAIPYPTVDPIWDKLCALFQGQASEGLLEWHGAVKAHLGECRVDVRAELGQASLRISELMRLSVGDVISVDKMVTEDLSLEVGGVVKFLGRPGLHRGNMAFQITSVV